MKTINNSNDVACWMWWRMGSPVVRFIEQHICIQSSEINQSIEHVLDGLLIAYHKQIHNDRLKSRSVHICHLLQSSRFLHGINTLLHRLHSEIYWRTFERHSLSSTFEWFFSTERFYLMVYPYLAPLPYTVWVSTWNLIIMSSFRTNNGQYLQMLYWYYIYTSLAYVNRYTILAKKEYADFLWVWHFTKYKTSFLIGPNGDTSIEIVRNTMGLYAGGGGDVCARRTRRMLLTRHSYLRTHRASNSLVVYMYSAVPSPPLFLFNNQYIIIMNISYILGFGATALQLSIVYIRLSCIRAQILIMVWWHDFMWLIENWL